MARIFIDPGHGGRDPGYVSKEGIRECDVVLAHAKTLMAELQLYGDHTIRLSRSTDRDLAADIRGPDWKSLDLSRRATLANQMAADAFVSLHANAGSRDANGVWVIHSHSSTRGKALATAVFKQLATVAGITDADVALEVYPDKSPWVGGRSLAVLRQTHMPAILVELGFLTNPDDLRQLTDVQQRKTIEAAIARGIKTWLTAR